MAHSNSSDVLSTERVFSFSPRQIFTAFEQPDQLAKWWGPNGFTNTFEKFAFKTGGQWDFVMHGPNGANYSNQCVFSEITPDSKIVITHTSQPHFTLTITLTVQGDKTLLKWAQAFETPEMADQLRPICEPSNEQNLDRLQAQLAKH